MAITTAEHFGHIVIYGDGSAVRGMGDLAQFAKTPLIKPALQFAAAWAYQQYLDQHKRPGARTGHFVTKACSLLADDVLKNVDRLSWTDVGGPFRAAFKVALADAFESYRADEAEAVAAEEASIEQSASFYAGLNRR